MCQKADLLQPRSNLTVTVRVTVKLRELFHLFMFVNSQSQSLPNRFTTNHQLSPS